MRPSAGRVASLAPLLVVVVALVALLVLRFQVLFTQNVNWDEFAFLAKVHSYLRGELSTRLLTFHVHFFTWVPALVDGELRQVLAMRLVMFACALATGYSTFVIGRRLLGSTSAAVFAVVAGQSLSHVITHGAAARYDPLVAAIFLGAGALLLSEKRGSAPVAGVLVAVGAMISLKIMLFVPSLLGVLALRAMFPGESPKAARAAAASAALLFVTALCAAFGVLYAVHAATLAAVPLAAVPLAAVPLAAVPLAAQFSADGVASMAGRALGDHDGKTGAYLMTSLTWDWAFWTLCILGFALAVAVVASPRRTRAERLASANLLCFALPLLALFVYRNAYPYFYSCVVPPAALVASLPLARLLHSLGQRPLLPLLVMGLALAPLIHGAVEWRACNLYDQLGDQRALIAAVHRVFPQPVPYLDRCSMIGSFRKVGPFMSAWTLERYREANQPIMRELLKTERPLFLLQNIETLRLTNAWDPIEPRSLLREDFDVLRDNFVPWWGPLWVAGKTVRVAKGEGAFEILIAGPYQAEPPVALRIDGVEVQPGAVVELAVGGHRLEATLADGVDTVTLHTASARAPPDAEPPASDEIFHRLTFRRRPPG